jgi:hypothetical protein
VYSSTNLCEDVCIFVEDSVDTVVLNAMQMFTICCGGLRLREGGDIYHLYLDLISSVQGRALCVALRQERGCSGSRHDISVLTSGGFN